MRKISVALLIIILGASCFGTLMGQALAQSNSPTPPPTTPRASPRPLTIRWLRYIGNITRWGSESYGGSVTVNAKTANATPAVFRPWVTVEAFWSNEPPFPATKPKGGQFTFTHYAARLVMLNLIRKQDDLILNVTGLWNVNKVKITTNFDQNGVPTKVVREVTLIVKQALGQLHITLDWKKFTIAIDGVDPLQGVEIRRMTTTNMMSPFSFGGNPSANINDLMQVVACFRAMPGFGNYVPELDYNKDSRIDIADLTTVAANM